MHVKLARLVACLPAATAGCGTSTGADCGPSSGVVARVIDGDTIVLTTGEKMRYLLIDAPETTNGHHDCYGSNAATYNSDLVLDKTVELTYDTQCTDRYGRSLAYISVDGNDVNKLMVERGYACVLFIAPDGTSRYDEFKAYQADAKASSRGVWGASDPLPPAC
jgi:micrococcal nuclease